MICILLKQIFDKNIHSILSDDKEFECSYGLISNISELFNKITEYQININEHGDRYIIYFNNKIPWFKVEYIIDTYYVYYFDDSFNYISDKIDGTKSIYSNAISNITKNIISVKTPPTINIFINYINRPNITEYCAVNGFPLSRINFHGYKYSNRISIKSK